MTSDPRIADLHSHTTASDGDHTPYELVRHAADLGLEVLAVTDHDTTGGLHAALAAGLELGVEVVPGIELSAEFSGGQCHILGLFIDPDSAALNGRLHEVLDNRNKRNARIVGKLQAHGVDITLEEIEAEAGGIVVARPHFAKVLIRKGVVSDVSEAFSEWLDRGAKAYVERDRLTPAESIGLIHAAGGVAVLAHPNNMKRDPDQTEVELVRLKELGLDGFEARYGRHTTEDTARYLDLAARRELLTAGGSDFHGPSVKPNVFLGHVEGELATPRSVVESLRSASTSLVS